MQEVYRVRRNLSTMKKQDDERQIYFICLKMIGILPPLSKELAQWSYFSGLGNKVQPKSLHDVLIASHSTACDHHTIYFGYYHRHLMILFELFLNFAYEVLKGGYIKLTQMYPKNQKNKFLYTSNGQDLQKDWKTFFDYYKELFERQQDHKQLSAHYWNATNYTNVDDLLIPYELRDHRLTKDKKLQPIDQLFLKVKGSYPWALNCNDRWGQDQKGIKITRWFQNNYILSDHYIPKGYDDDKDKDVYKTINSIVNVKSNPRQHPKMDFSYWLKKFQLYKEVNSNLVNKRCNDYYSQQNTLAVCAITENETIINYGGKVTHNGKKYQFQYISNEERKLDKFKRYDFYPGLINNYNLSLPHYTYARALFTSKNFHQFIYDSNNFERSHDILHDNLRSIFNNGNYSLCNLAFFPYHSWIDLALQFKIRQSSQTQSIDAFMTKLHKGIDKTNRSGLLAKYIDQKDIDEQLELSPFNVYKNNSNYKHIQKGQYGYYPVLQYVSPQLKQQYDKDLDFARNHGGTQPQYSRVDVKNISPAFTTRDYSLLYNPKNKTTQFKLRNTKQLQQIYQYYINYHKDGRFKKFEGFSKFKFSYDYQVAGIQDKNSKQLFNQLLNDHGLNLPKYLQDFTSQFPGYPLTERLLSKNITLQSSQPNPQPSILTLLFSNQRTKIQQNSIMFMIQPPKAVLEEIQNNNNQIKLEQEPNNLQIQQQQQYTLTRVFKNNLIGHVKYKASIRNGLYSMNLSVKNLIFKLIQNPNCKIFLQNKQYSSIIEQLIKNGLWIKHYSIFGKQQQAQSCLNCTQYKDDFINLDDDLRKSSPLIWEIVHLNSLTKIVYKSSQKVKVGCIMKQIDAIPIPNFEKFELITGSQQIYIQLQTNIQTPIKKSSIRIDAYSYSGLTGEHKDINSKYQRNLKNGLKFDFYKNHSIRADDKFNISDRYVYKEVKVNIEIDKDKSHFSSFFEFRVPCFQRLLRYKLFIDEIPNVKEGENEFQIKVEDIDYDKKQKYYSNYNECQKILKAGIVRE